MPDRLIIHGAPPSQPTRAVCWTCLIKGLPFEVRTEPFRDRVEGKAERRIDILNPKHQVPVIEDGDFVLYEMPAILGYLSDKHGWEDLNPKDLETRAVVNQYLHFHHTTTRLATLKLMGPHVTIAFGGPNPSNRSLDPVMVDTIVEVMNSEDPLRVGREAVKKQLPIIETGYFPADSSFLCGTSGPTIADIACYEELAQLQWAHLFTFEDYPKISAWLDAMASLPAHDAAHRYNLVLGDIATVPNTLERFVSATTAGFEALAEAGARVQQGASLS